MPIVQPISLYNEIKSMKKPSIKRVRRAYGSFGLDLYQGKDSVTILTKKQKEKTFIDKVVKFFTGREYVDYEQNDTLFNVVLKYCCNNEVGLVADIKNKFGERGVDVLRRLQSLGYVSP